jgi:hypothetical protein
VGGKEGRRGIERKEGRKKEGGRKDVEKKGKGGERRRAPVLPAQAQ